MKLIILGSSASYALPGEATAGYLIKTEAQSIAIDMGTGSLSNLFRWQDPADLDALVLSHLHADHFADIFSLRLYLNFERPQKRLTVYAPKGAAAKIGSVMSAKGQEIFKKKLIFKDISENTVKIGKFKIAFAKMVHEISSYALRVENGSKSLVYTSDTAYNKKLVKLADDADLLLAEATLSIDFPAAGHMSAADAGRLAGASRVKKLVLTHIWPTFKDKKIKADAAGEFDGKIEIAAANKVFEI